MGLRRGKGRVEERRKPRGLWQDTESPQFRSQGPHVLYSETWFRETAMGDVNTELTDLPRPVWKPAHWDEGPLLPQQLPQA